MSASLHQQPDPARVLDRQGWPLHPTARVRVEHPSEIVPGRVIRCRGVVVSVYLGLRRGAPAMLVAVRGDGESFTRTVMPADCTVIARRARRR